MSSRVLSFTFGGSGGFVAADPAEPVLADCFGVFTVVVVFGRCVVVAVGVGVGVAEPASAASGGAVGVATGAVVGGGGGGVAVG